MRCPALLLTAWLSAGCCTAGPGLTEPLPRSAFDEKVAELSEAYRFRVVAVPPFVVVGGGPEHEVNAFADEVIGWAVRGLQRELFDRHPRRIVEIWALRTAGSYSSWAGEAIGGTPSSPYGVYSPCAGAIIVNRGLGDGTVVHEMVHVFVDVDFPSAPTWLNEGLGSLYEQPAERDGHIVGLVNWRLPGLQRRLREGTAPSLSDVMTTSRFSFYGENAGIHYAIARYLFFYLQERGALRRYYRAFRDGDADGVATLEHVLGEPIERIEARWRRFVLTLSLPARTPTPT